MGILDTNGLKKLQGHILQALEIKVDKELNKTLTTNDYTDEEKDKVDYAYTQVKDIQENIALALYPIGSIYININDVNPSTLFGGTWERIKDVILLLGFENNNGVYSGDIPTLLKGSCCKH